MMQRLERIATIQKYEFTEHDSDKIVNVFTPGNVQFYIRHVNDDFIVYRNERGEGEVFRSNDVEHAILMLSTLFDDGFHSKPEELRNMIDLVDPRPVVSDTELETVVSRYIDPFFFSFGSPVHGNRIWLRENDDSWDVVYRDLKGQDGLISKKSSRGMGIFVLSNYAWALQYMWARTMDWGFNPEDPQLNRILHIIFYGKE
jgi:hypothetical protein